MHSCPKLLIMKLLYFLVFLLLISCSETVEDRCFAGLKDKLTYYREKKSFTADQILKNKPDYLEIINLKKYRSFKQDSTESIHRYDSDEVQEERWKAHQKEYKVFKESFSDQFSFSNKQQVGTGFMRWELIISVPGCLPLRTTNLLHTFWVLALVIIMSTIFSKDQLSKVIFLNSKAAL